MKKEILLLGAAIAAVIAALAVVFLRTSFTPTLASEQGESIDHSLELLFAIAAGVFALIVGVLGYSIWRFRRRNGERGDGPPIQSNGWLVAAFFFIPAGLVLWSATFGALELRDVQRRPPPGVEELEVKVTSFQWAWLFTYPSLGITTGELVLPVDQPTLFKLTSRDVIHAFWVPEWRPKIDAVPGMETELRVTPNRTGNFHVECAELCGLGHSIMRAPARVVSDLEFLDWVKQLKG